jgi:hypothetical protein
MTIVITKYRPDYKQSLIDFLKYKWNDLDECERKQRFEWRYLQNPYQKKPYVYLAVDNDTVVGFRGAVTQLFESTTSGKAGGLYCEPLKAVIKA